MHCNLNNISFSRVTKDAITADGDRNWFINSNLFSVASTLCKTEFVSVFHDVQTT